MSAHVRRATGVAVLSLATALAQTAPLALHLGSAIPFGTYPAPVVPRLNLWALWWNSERLLHGYRGYWQAPIFHPDPFAFAYTEPQWLSGLVAGALWWTTARPAFAYDAVVLIAFTLNGCCGYFLLRRLRIGFWPALCGGLVIEMLPFVADQIGVLQSTVLFPIPMTLACLVGFGRTGSAWSALGGVLWMAVCYHTSANTALFFGPAEEERGVRRRVVADRHPQDASERGPRAAGPAEADQAREAHRNREEHGRLQDADLICHERQHLDHEPAAEGGPEADAQAPQEEVAAAPVQRERNQHDRVVGQRGAGGGPPEGAGDEAAQPLRFGVGEGERVGVEDGCLPVPAVAMEQPLAVPPERPEVQPRDDGRRIGPERDGAPEVQRERRGLRQRGREREHGDPGRAPDVGTHPADSACTRLGSSRTGLAPPRGAAPRPPPAVR